MTKRWTTQCSFVYLCLLGSIGGLHGLSRCTAAADAAQRVDEQSQTEVNDPLSLENALESGIHWESQVRPVSEQTVPLAAVAQLKIGMTKQQVEFLLKERLLKSVLDQTHWFYIDFYQANSKHLPTQKRLQRTLTLRFTANGYLEKIQVQYFPNELLAPELEIETSEAIEQPEEKVDEAQAENAETIGQAEEEQPKGSTTQPELIDEVK